MNAPDEYCVDKRGDLYPPETISHYLGGAGMAGGFVEWDGEIGAWKLHSRSIYDQTPQSPEQVKAKAGRLSLAAPGLKIVKTKHVKAKGYRSYDQGYIWYTWSVQAMDNRLQELWEKHGVADWRLELYERCRWAEEPKQPSLPGVIHVEGYSSANGPVRSSYTGYAMQSIDSGFVNRIMRPNRGGKEAEYFQTRICHVGNEKWYVGTRGDSADILSLEIQASPLDARTKENLLSNLETFPRDATQRLDRFA